MDISRIAWGDLKPVLKRAMKKKKKTSEGRGGGGGGGGAIFFNSFLKDYVFVPLLISSVWHNSGKKTHISKFKWFAI